MTSHSETASLGVARRPAPPRSAASIRAFASPVTYLPEQYDPRQQPAPIAVTAGHFGLVHPKPRTGRAVWLALLVIVASVVGFLGWRVLNTTAGPTDVTYTSAAGHFTASFPAQPIETMRSESHGKWRLEYHTVAVAGRAVVTEATVVGRLPAANRLGEVMVARFTDVAGLTLSSIKNFTFHGDKARQGTFFTLDGQAFSVLVVAPPGRRIYALSAPLGTAFDTLKESFVIAG
jgi:hypothetical protein